MAEEYVIRITADGSAQDSGTVPVAIPGAGGVTTPKASTPSATSGDASVQLTKMVATGALVPAVTTLASTGVSMVGLATGNNKMQQRINIATSMASKGSAAFGSAKVGFAVGGPAGAAVGIAVWGIGEATNVMATAMRHDIEHRNECYKLGVTRERAGLTTNRRRR